MFSKNMFSNLGSVVLYVKSLLHHLEWHCIVKTSERFQCDEMGDISGNQDHDLNVALPMHILSGEWAHRIVLLLDTENFGMQVLFLLPKRVAVSQKSRSAPILELSSVSETWLYHLQTED